MSQIFNIPCQVAWSHKAEESFIRKGRYLALGGLDEEWSVNHVFVICESCAEVARRLPDKWKLKPLPAEWLPDGGEKEQPK